MSTIIEPSATSEVRHLTERLGPVARLRRTVAQSGDARRAMEVVDANRIENATRVAISAQDAATSITLAAINSSGTQRMTVVHVELVTSTNAAAATLDDVAIAAALRSSQRSNGLEADLVRRRDAGEISAAQYEVLSEQVRKADERRRSIAFEAAEGAINDLRAMGKEARRGASGER